MNRAWCGCPCDDEFIYHSKECRKAQLYVNPPWWRLDIRFKLWVAGYSRWSSCSIGLHRWSHPGGTCEKCGKKDNFYGA